MIIRVNKFILWFISFIFLISVLPVAIISECKTQNDKEIILPVIMYHHITTDKNKSGKYTVLQSEFEADLEFIKSSGYKTITPLQLSDMLEQGKKPEDKVIMITFDDGFESFYKLSFPLLRRYNMKAVLSVIGIQSEKYSETDDHNINYSNLNWNTISVISESGNVEIGNHTFDMHYNQAAKRKGMDKMRNESDEKYKRIIFTDINKMQNLLKEKSGVDCRTIAYPYGIYNSLTTEIIKDMNFVCSLTCEEKINFISDTDDLYNLGRYNRPSGISSEDFFDDIFIEAEKYQADAA